MYQKAHLNRNEVWFPLFGKKGTIYLLATLPLFFANKLLIFWTFMKEFHNFLVYYYRL